MQLSIKSEVTLLEGLQNHKTVNEEAPRAPLETMRQSAKTILGSSGPLKTVKPSAKATSRLLKDLNSHRMCHLKLYFNQQLLHMLMVHLNIKQLNQMPHKLKK